jgi:CheY-like chemotaxis protein
MRWRETLEMVGGPRVLGRKMNLALRRILSVWLPRDCFCIWQSCCTNSGVISPLALVYYEDLMPGSQLVNRLQDLRYRVQTLATVQELAAAAASTGPMLVILDLVSRKADMCGVIRGLKAERATSHLPILGFGDDGDEALQAGARTAGATVVVGDSVVVAHLPQFIERALQVE